jgi:hypothetical protein
MIRSYYFISLYYAQYDTIIFHYDTFYFGTHPDYYDIIMLNNYMFHHDYCQCIISKRILISLMTLLLSHSFFPASIITVLAILGIFCRRIL